VWRWKSVVVSTAAGEPLTNRPAPRQAVQLGRRAPQTGRGKPRRPVCVGELVFRQFRSNIS
jgi:hypothetical protein